MGLVLGIFETRSEEREYRIEVERSLRYGSRFRILLYVKASGVSHPEETQDG